jgi:hypothetical protein
VGLLGNTVANRTTLMSKHNVLPISDKTGICLRPSMCMFGQMMQACEMEWGCAYASSSTTIGVDVSIVIKSVDTLNSWEPKGL